MFKSVFTKYLTTFTVIILFSFIILILVMSSIVTNYSIETKKLMLDRSAELSAKSLDPYFDNDKIIFKEEIIRRNSGKIMDALAGTARLADADIYVLDTAGNQLVSNQSTRKEYNMVDKAIMTEVLHGSQDYLISDLGGRFEKNRLNYFYIIERDNGPYLVVLVSSTDFGDALLANRMVGTLISVSIWILLAALISVYFISNRIVDPLKEISRAAGDFAQGKFDRRVQVVGQDEVAALAATFNNMAESLASLEEMRSSFLANVSHDLRTPMTTIAGFVDGILDGTIPPEKQNHYLGIISTEVRRLSRLVSSLLQLSKMESGSLELKKQDFNMSEKARQILLSFESKIDQKHLSVEFNGGETDIFVHANTDGIHQVLYNLMDNAIKFSPEGGTLSLTLRVDATDKRNRKAIVAVRNTGQGIPPDELPNLFERFYKSDRSRGLDKSGMGLGLYIAKTMLQSHGETISANSVVGEYTEFSFSLPLATTKKEIALG